jgi:hypothetical protein
MKKDLGDYSSCEIYTVSMIGNLVGFVCVEKKTVVLKQFELPSLEASVMKKINL